MDDADFIKFNCQHCGGRIRVPKIHAGKKGNCPKCDHVIVIPFESAAIKLQCKNCGLKISVPKLHEGKDGFCPKCKCPILIPRDQSDASEDQSDTEEPNTRLVGNAGNLTLLNVPEEYKLQDQPVNFPNEPENATLQEPETPEESTPEESEPTGHRKLPWLIDIFLYPISMSGLMHLGIFTLIPPLIVIIGFFGIRMGCVGLLMNVAIGLYMFWYFNECVRDSAQGNTRAPEAFATADLSEMWSQALHVISCFFIFAAPVLFYYIFTKKTDAVFWLLLFYGVFFFPMCLLSTIMFDSIRGLNPILLIRSILSTFFQYTGLVLLLGGIVLAFINLTSIKLQEDNETNIGSLLLNLIFFMLLIYMTFVLAHLLGRFYWRNREKLNWEV